MISTQKIFVISLLAVVFCLTPLVLVGASHGGAHPGDAGFQNLPEGPQSGKAAGDTLEAVTDWIFAFLMLVAVIYLVLAAYQFITGGGDPQQVNQARQKLVYATVGIGLALAARGVDNVLRNVIG